MKAEIRDDGWHRHNIWEHSASVAALYARRARDEDVEMTAAAQAAEILAGLAAPGDSVLDAGCGAGHFYHSLRRRSLDLDYHGIDASPSLIEIGRSELARFGVAPDRLRCLRIEDLAGAADHVLCLNVLSNIDNYPRPLERLLETARKSVILRESLKDGASFSYVRDAHLDPGANLKVHVNAYDRTDVLDFIRSYGFQARIEVDRYTGGEPQLVIGYPHWWTFVVATREA